MNTELIVQLRDLVESLSTKVDNISKTVNALKINDQRRLDANTDIPPGVACKVAYDKHGLILQGTKLEHTDIPELSIDKIVSLRKSLEDKASNRDFDVFKSSIIEMIKPVSSTLKEISGTGIKVNYNSDGRIISTSDLLASDIPILPISKIEGLSDFISSINSISLTSDNDNDIPSIKTNSGTFAKVTIDQYGRVLSGDKLTINDIPMELINRINQIESNIVNLASQHSLDAISKELSNKVSSNKTITPGTYTKIKVDSNGLVTKGEMLTIRDLPELHTSDITNLDKILQDKANRVDFINLNDTVSSLVNSLSTIGEISGMKNELKSKASDQDVKELNSKVKSIQHTLDSVVNNLPSDMLTNQLYKIQLELSNINSRISIIENKLNIE